MNNAILQVATALAALAPLVSDLLVQHFSGHWAMAAFTVAIGISTVLALTLKGMRQAEEQQPGMDLAEEAR